MSTTELLMKAYKAELLMKAYKDSGVASMLAGDLQSVARRDGKISSADDLRKLYEIERRLGTAHAAAATLANIARGMEPEKQG